MLIKTLPVGQLETNCYIVINQETLACVLIDPGDESNTILDYIEDNKLNLRAIFLTHGHFDHTGAVNAIVEEKNCPVFIHKLDTGSKAEPYSFLPPEGCRFYGDGDVLEIAGLHFGIMHTPGHTQGGVSIICENALFTGDTLFKGSCGRTDLPGGDMDQQLLSLKKLCSLKGDYEVYPGHMDSSTLERERLFNYYCRHAMSM